MRNKIGGNTGHLMEIKRIINECYEQLYDHKFDNLVEVDQYLCQLLFFRDYQANDLAYHYWAIESWISISCNGKETINTYVLS